MLSNNVNGKGSTDNAEQYLHESTNMQQVMNRNNESVEHDADQLDHGVMQSRVSKNIDVQFGHSNFGSHFQTDRNEVQDARFFGFLSP